MVGKVTEYMCHESVPSAGHRRVQGRMGWVCGGRLNHSYLHTICHKDIFCVIIKKTTHPCVTIKLRKLTLWVSLSTVYISILQQHTYAADTRYLWYLYSQKPCIKNIVFWVRRLLSNGWYFYWEPQVTGQNMDPSHVIVVSFLPLTFVTFF